MAGDPSSWSKLKLACKSCPSLFGMNLRQSVSKQSLSSSLSQKGLEYIAFKSTEVASVIKDYQTPTARLQSLQTTPICSTLRNQRNRSYLSPYTLCRFRLGLPPGVISLRLPASSNSFNRALLNLFGSMASAFGVALLLRAMFSSTVFLSDFLFSPAGGGVALRGGVATGGVFKACAVLVICAWEMVEA